MEYLFSTHNRFSTLIISTAIAFFQVSLSQAQSVAGCAPGSPCLITTPIDDVPVNVSLYYYFLPDNYDPSAEYPLLISLHGSGCRGVGDQCVRNTTQTSLLIERTRSDYPAILFVPQLAAGTYSLHNPADLTLSIASSIVEELNVDPDRIYLTGSSMGGFGTSTYLAELFEGIPIPPLPLQVDIESPPQRILENGALDQSDSTLENSLAAQFRIAAAAPMDGSYLASSDPAFIDYLQNTPIWIGHGGADPIVSVDFSRNFFRDIIGLNDGEPIPFDNSFIVGNAPTAQIGKTFYSEVPGGLHNIRDQFYSDDFFMDWMFSQSLAIPEPSTLALALPLAGPLLLRRYAKSAG